MGFAVGAEAGVGSEASVGAGVGVAVGVEGATGAAHVGTVVGSGEVQATVTAVPKVSRTVQSKSLGRNIREPLGCALLISSVPPIYE